MTFERYHLQRSSPLAAGMPIVVLRAGGELALTPAALALIGSPARVGLYFDRERKLVGLAAADDQFARPVRGDPRAGRVSLLATRGLVGFYGVAGRCRGYTPRLVDGLLVFGPVELASEPSATPEQVRSIVRSAVEPVRRNGTAALAEAAV